MFLKNLEDPVTCIANSCLITGITLRRIKIKTLVSPSENLSFFLIVIIFFFLRLLSLFSSSFFSHKLFSLLILILMNVFFPRHNYLECFFITCPHKHSMLFLFHCGQKTFAVRFKPFETH